MSPKLFISMTLEHVAISWILYFIRSSSYRNRAHCVCERNSFIYWFIFLTQPWSCWLHLQGLFEVTVTQQRHWSEEKCPASNLWNPFSLFTIKCQLVCTSWVLCLGMFMPLSVNEHIFHLYVHRHLVFSMFTKMWDKLNNLQPWYLQWEDAFIFFLTFFSMERVAQRLWDHLSIYMEGSCKWMFNISIHCIC